MHTSSAVLAPALQDLVDTLSELRGSTLEAAEILLTRFVSLLDNEPLGSLLTAILPVVEFRPWWDIQGDGGGGLGGSGAIHWPTDRELRVAMQVELCRAMVRGEVQLLDVVTEYFYTRGGLSVGVTAFTAKVLEPLCRDIKRLCEQRHVPQVLSESMAAPKPSGDQTLDAMLKDACTKFRDPAPKARAEATEKLWDAWERLKSTEAAGNKRQSIGILLERAASEATFRALLEAEARLLTDIGNKYHLRHFETDKISIEDAGHYEYLFHRLYALINLLLARQAPR